MAIQPFAMQGQVANIMLPSEAIQGAAQAKAAQNRNAMFEMEVKDKQNLDQAYRESGGDINAMMKNPNLGFEAGTRLQEISSENVKAQNTAKIGQLDFMLKGAEYSAQLAGSAQNQADWDRVRQHAIDTLGAQAAETFPAEFSESARNQVLQGAMSFKDKLDLQRSQLQMQREERMAGQQDRMYQLAVGREGRLAAGGGGDSKPEKAPAHYRFTADGNLEPIPGGAADLKVQAQSAKIQAQQNKDIAKLENADASASQTLQLIDQIASHKGKADAVGLSSVVNVAAIPGSDRQDFLTKLEQLKGQQFLQAFESLKGAGAITEIEGKKAEQAIANLNTAQSEEQFDSAVSDFKSVIQSGQTRIRNRAAQYNAVDNGMGGSVDNSLPPDVTEDDIQETMRANNMTRDQVLQRLGGR